MRRRSALFLIFCLCLLPRISVAAELTGYVAMDTRLFWSKPAFGGQDQNNAPSFAIEPEVYHVTEDDKFTFTFKPFFRFDPVDKRRTHGDVRQMDVLYAADDWELRAGAGRVFWGVTESNHLVDIINQTDSIEDSDGEDKLGQPMIQAAFMRDWGTVRLYYLPYFRERSFPGLHGRLRGPVLIDTSRTAYDSSMKAWHPDFAVRYTHVFGDWDIGLAHFSGTSREPRLMPGFNALGAPIFIPYYDHIEQSSLDLQYTKEGWLWKLEAIGRSGHGDRFYAVSGGFEYSFYNVKDSGYDIGVLAEYHRDMRDSTAPVAFLDRDLFLGTRLVLNDIADTQLLAGLVIDLSDETQSFFMEASRRIGDNWKIELDLRASGHVARTNPALAIRRDDHIQLRLARYF